MNTHPFLRYALLGGLLFTPFIAFVVTQSMLFPFVTGKAFTFRLLVSVLFLLWVVAATKDAQYRPQLSSVFAAIVLFVGVMGLSTLFAVNPSFSFWGNYERMEGFVLLIHLLLYFVVAVSVLRQQQDWDWFWYSFLTASALMGAYNLYQIVQLGTSARIDGTFGNPTYLSVFMLVLFFVNLFLFVQKKIPLLAFSVLATVQCVVIYFTGTRGAMIGLFGGLLLTALLIAIGDKAHQRLRLLSSGLIAALLLVAIGLFSAKDTAFVQESPVLSRFANISLNNESAVKDSRLYVWPIAIEGFQQKPLLGWGQEGFRYVFDEHYNPEMFDREAWYDRVHSIPLDWLVAGGLLGFLSYGGLFAAALYTLWRRTALTYTSKSVLTGLFAAYLLQNLFVFDNLLSYILFFSLLAYLHFEYTRTALEPSNKAPDWLASLSPAWRAAPVVALAVFAVATYSVNFKPIAASQAYVSGLKKLNVANQPTEALLDFENAFALNAIHNLEILEMTSVAASKYFQETTPASVRERFFNLVDTAYSQQLARFPNDARSRLFYGQFLYQAGQVDAALAELYKAHDLSPQRQNILFPIGAIYLDNGVYQAATDIFKRYFELEPRFNNARLMYGVSLLYANDNKRAQEILDELPVDVLVMSEPLVNVLVHRGDFNALVQLFLERLALDPEDMTNHIKLAEFYIRTGDSDAAIDLLDTYLERNPQHESDLRSHVNDMKATRESLR